MIPGKEAWESIPTRHGADLRASRAMAARLRMLIPGDAEPDAASWNKLGRALSLGDPLADALVAWMHAEGLATSWALFEQALAGCPQALLAERARPLRDFMLHAQTKPPWLDDAMLRRGARFLQSSGLHGMMVLRDAALMAGYQASAINQTLLKTGMLRGSAYKRVAETSIWWLACTEVGGMAPTEEGFRQTLRVRVAHALVRCRVTTLPDWEPHRYGLPINQVDMQATYLAFSVVHLLALRMTGVFVSRRDSLAVMHLWRYIAWLSGLEDEWLCDDERQGRILLYRNVISQAPADDTSRILARALMDEPLQRRYAWGAAWRGRVNRALHLSLVRWFIGAQGMRRLGLPFAFAWYPVLLLAPLAMRSVLLQVVPCLKPWWRAWARRQQTAYLRILKAAAPVTPASQAERQARL
jgi:hypothetical protein